MSQHTAVLLFTGAEAGALHCETLQSLHACANCASPRHDTFVVVGVGWIGLSAAVQSPGLLSFLVPFPVSMLRVHTGSV